MARLNFLAVPTFLSNKDEHLRLLSNAVNGIRDGKLNSIGEITLTNSSTTTTITDARIGGDSMILLSPSTSDAASENWYITNYDKGSAIINHSSDTTTRTFKYVVF